MTFGGETRSQRYQRLRSEGVWDPMTQLREEVYFTKGRIIVRGKKVSRGKAKFADYVLYYRPNVPIAVVEAKDNNHTIGDASREHFNHDELLRGSERRSRCPLRSDR